MDERAAPQGISAPTLAPGHRSARTLPASHTPYRSALVGAETQQRPAWRRAVRRHRAFGRRGGPLPRRPTDKVNRCDRNKQLTWQRQQEVLYAHRDELASQIRGAATASAAIAMLDLLPRPPRSTPVKEFRGRLRRSRRRRPQHHRQRKLPPRLGHPLYKDRSFWQLVAPRNASKPPSCR